MQQVLVLMLMSVLMYVDGVSRDAKLRLYGFEWRERLTRSVRRDVDIQQYIIQNSWVVEGECGHSRLDNTLSRGVGLQSRDVLDEDLDTLQVVSYQG